LLKEELVIGRVLSAFGKDGEIKVESLSGEKAHFADLHVVNMKRGSRTEHFRVESVRNTHRAVLIKLEGVDTPEAAAMLRGGEIVVARADAVKLEPGEYYYADLDGLEITLNGGPIGRVSAIWESGPYPLLEVTLHEGKSVLVPFVDQFFGEVDLAVGQMELRDGMVLE
jgi:16S rRNA processing protein RimM